MSATAREAGAVAPSLQGAVTIGGTSWAVLKMGRSSGTYNYFWQLFVLRPGATHWALATPPGVADNGGLVAATDSSGIDALVGFGPSQGLTFSPLALSTDTGSKWAAGGLSDALVASPSALAVGDGARTALALVRGPDERVLERTGETSTWRTIVTARELMSTSPGRACGIVDLTAVATDPRGDLFVGGACKRAGEGAILRRVNGAWRQVPIEIPRDLVESSFEVLRMTSSSALFTAERGDRRELVAAWQSSDGSWSLSVPTFFPPSDDLVATGSGPNAEQFAVIAAKGVARFVTISKTDHSWQSGVLPHGTSSVAITAGGRLEAIVVDGSHFTAWQQGSGSSKWVRMQSTTVPIEYGSSS